MILGTDLYTGQPYLILETTSRMDNRYIWFEPSGKTVMERPYEREVVRWLHLTGRLGEAER